MAVKYLKSDGTPGKTKRERCESRGAAMIQTRMSGFDEHWRELSEYILPRRTRFFTEDRNRGDKRNQKIINSTATFSARTLASGLHAGLTSPARPWMKLTTPDQELAKHGPVKKWLHDVTQRMLTVFAQTNVYNAFPVVYGDLGVFGTAAMAVVPDSKDLFRCYPFALGSFAIGLNKRGLVSSFVREYELSVAQVVEEFGLFEGTTDIDWSKLSTNVKNLWDRGDYESPVKVTWLVEPNENANPKNALAKFMPFASYHFEQGSNVDGKQFLRESGFLTFPIMAPRWDITDGDSYGTDCPGMTARGDVKQLQVMERRKGQAIAKMVDPPLTGPTALRQQKTSLLPADITYVDVREGQQGLRSIHDVNLRVDHLSMECARVENRIQRAFYEDMFLMLARSDSTYGSGAPVTAREVEERHEEKLIALGPVLERTNDELLDPLVDRVFQMMQKADLIPEAPEELEGVDLKVEYISILSQAQKLVGVVGLDRLLTSSVALAQTFPEVIHKIKIGVAVDDYAEMLGTNPRIIRTDEEMDERMQEAAKQQQQLADAKVARDTAAAVKDAGQTPMDGDTALSRIVGNVAPAA